MYKLHKETKGVIRLSDNTYIPPAVGNRDWDDYLAWKEAGGVPAPADVKTESVKEKRAKIDEERDKKLKAGVQWGPDGNLFHTDDQFITQLIAFITAFNNGVYPEGTKKTIRTVDDKLVKLGKSDIVALTAAVGQYVESVYAESWALKDALPKHKKGGG